MVTSEGELNQAAGVINLVLMLSGSKAEAKVEDGIIVVREAENEREESGDAEAQP